MKFRTLSVIALILSALTFAGCSDASEDLAHFGFVIDEPQQRFAARTTATDTQNVFGRRVQIGDQQVVVEQNDARGETVEDFARVVAQRAAAGTAAVYSTVFC